MISLQRLIVSALLILSVTFVFFAQSAEASKGPKITHKVSSELSLLLCEVWWLLGTFYTSIGKILCYVGYGASTALLKHSYRFSEDRKLTTPGLLRHHPWRRRRRPHRNRPLRQDRPQDC